MRVTTSRHQIAITLVDTVQLEARELAFLRTMARHCQSTGLCGSAACGRLDALLADMGVKTYDEIDGGPVMDLFRKP